VFVDDTGRRHRVVRVIGWTVGGITLAYLALLGISLVGSPGLVPLSLPAIGRVLPDPSAPQIGTAVKYGGSPLAPDRSVDTPPADGTGPTTSVGGASVPSPTSAAPTPRRTPSPSASTASPTRTPQANPTPAGTPRASRSPSAHPSPKSTHASPRNVKGTPTPSPT